LSHLSNAQIYKRELDEMVKGKSERREEDRERAWEMENRQVEML
jgi:hypothetical protein